MSSLVLPYPSVYFKKLNSVLNVVSYSYYILFLKVLFSFTKTTEHCISHDKRNNYILVIYQQ